MRAVIAAVLLIAGSVPVLAGMPAQFKETLQCVDGSPPVRLSSYKSKVLLLEFWATYCVPCAEARPYFEELQRRFADRGLVVLAVDVGEDAQTVKTYLKAHPTPLKVVLDPKRRLAGGLLLSKEPAMALFDTNDELDWSAAGFAPGTKEELSSRLDRALPGERGSVPLGALK